MAKIGYIFLQRKFLLLKSRLTSKLINGNFFYDF
jgi:hypothetical protein